MFYGIVLCCCILVAVVLLASLWQYFELEEDVVLYKILPMNNAHLQAKEAILKSQYGKFDLVTHLMPEELLLFGKPRRVAEWLVQDLQLKDEDINSNTLRSWLYRYRKSQRVNTSTIITQQWQQFEPTPVSKPVADEKMIIKKVPVK